MFNIKEFIRFDLQNNLGAIIDRIIFPLIILAFGIILGKIISHGLKKIAKKLDLSKHIQGSFIELFIVVARWSIYLIFLNLAIEQLKIKIFTDFFGKILLTIPSFMIALIIIIIGIVIAIYLKKNNRRSKNKRIQIYI